jgi:2'-5' RNA ligase
MDMYYGIAVYPSKEIQDFANHYRRRYDPHYGWIDPHLTVRDKQACSEQEVQAAIHELERIADALQPFELHFNRFSTFYPVNNVIYMAVSNPQPMIDLHEELRGGSLGEQSKPYVYTPHLTIAQELNDDELHDVLASLKNKPLDHKCTIDRLALMRQDENGKWSPIRQFML